MFRKLLVCLQYEESRFLVEVVYLKDYWSDDVNE